MSGKPRTRRKRRSASSRAALTQRWIISPPLQRLKFRVWRWTEPLRFSIGLVERRVRCKEPLRPRRTTEGVSWSPSRTEAAARGAQKTPTVAVSMSWTGSG